MRPGLLRLLRLRKDSGDDSPKHEEDGDEEDEDMGKALPLWSPERCRASLMLDPVLAGLAGTRPACWETLILGEEAENVDVGSQFAIDLLLFLILSRNFKALQLKMRAIN